MQADVEKLMARLFTDAASRERFVADPATVAKEAGLSAEETEAVLRIDLRDLATAARSYDHKRRSQRRSEFPLRDWWRAWRR
jgi:hypothetical protein